MFDAQHSRFATFGVISKIPGELIDRVWFIIDNDLRGLVPLDNLLKFKLINNGGSVSIHFSQQGLDTAMAFDQDIEYQDGYPDMLLAYDDGDIQTILLPEEANEH
ncbi:DUF960 domain-containing protein [Lacticaseibacillus thailandensis]|nr:DUF960 domain-containing protein [Lacticaseibacillus thailandensis]